MTTPPGALVQLGATGRINTAFPELASKKSYTVQKLPAAKTHPIPFSGDVVSLIAIDLSGDLGDDSLRLKIGEETVLRVPLSILALTGRRTGSILQFDFGAFLPDLPLVIRTNYYVSLTSDRPFGLQLRYTLLETDARIAVSRSLQNYPFQQVSTWTNMVPSSEITIDPPFTGLSKGYIVEAPDVSQLRRFRLQINERERWDYDTDLLTTCTHRLSPRHLWIPFNPTLPPTPFSRTADSFVGGLNHSLFASCEFYLEFAEPQAFIAIHNFNLSVLRTHNLSVGVSREYEDGTP